MADAIILEFTGVDADQYWAVNDKLGIDMKGGSGPYPAGLITHAGGLADDGRFVVSEVWESRDAQSAFMAGQLGAALGTVGVPEPDRVTWISLEAHQEPGA